jgi:alkylresorcinol/alkylpyrone synthase
MQIASVGTAFPSHRYSQPEIAQALTDRWRNKLEEPRMVGRLFANCGVEHRFLAFPLETYPTLVGFGRTNTAWIDAAVALGEQAIHNALDPLGLTASDISAIFFASVTGIASPTIDARLINRLPFPTHVKRTPIFGLGCVAGAAGIARASDYVRAFPHQIALLLSIELCSLTWQDDDLSIANLISCGLFGDGAAAVVIAGDQAHIPAHAASNGHAPGNGHYIPTAVPTPAASSNGAAPKPGPRVLATCSTFYRDTQYVMGWDICDTGFKIVLSPDVPKVVEENLRGDVDRFLGEHQLSLSDISSWIFHSGGPKVLEAMQSSLDLPPNSLEPSWKSLREVGNLSAASVLCVLEDYLAHHRGDPGTYSILAAMGPGFCSELVLLQWE